MPSSVNESNAERSVPPAIGVIGAPCDVGAARRGNSMGPEALRVAGFEQALANLGYRINDHGNLSGPSNPMQPAIEGHCHLDEVLAWCGTIRDAVAASLDADELPVLLGGDHSVSIGSIAAVSRHCAEANQPLTVLWLDAHADCNTAATSPSGNIHGMAAAAICGEAHARLLQVGEATPMVAPENIFQVGLRSVDALEKRTLVERGLRTDDMRRIDELGMRAVMARVLDNIRETGGHLHVSFDLDFVDPTTAPGVGTPVRGGPTYREAQLCMEMIHDSGLLGSFDVVEVNPALDTGNRTAELAVELVKSLLGEQILAKAV